MVCKFRNHDSMTNSNNNRDIAEPAVPMPGPRVRAVLSVLLAAYLMVVLLGPLANPIGSSNLTIPMSRLVAPVHQALFLGHGYRFFGPDPGPSHILEYRIESADGEEINDKFPDRDQHWPRLLYHRWFMLCLLYTSPSPRDRG